MRYFLSAEYKHNLLFIELRIFKLKSKIFHKCTLDFKKAYLLIMKSKNMVVFINLAIVSEIIQDRNILGFKTLTQIDNCTFS